MKDHLGVYYDRTSDFQQEQFLTLRGLIDDYLTDKAAVRSLLDIGCRSGGRTYQSFDVFPELEKITAIEPDWEMIEVAKEKYTDSRITYKGMTAEAMSGLAEEGQTYDAAIANWSLHWVEDKDAMFNGLNALTRPGSWFMFSTCERLPAILRMIDTYVRNEFRVPADSSPFHYLALDEWREMLTRHGWTVVGQKAREVTHEVEDASQYLDHWFTASAAKFLYGKHLAEVPHLTHSDLVWMMNRAFPSQRNENGLSFQEDTMFVVARRA